MVLAYVLVAVILYFAVKLTFKLLFPSQEPEESSNKTRWFGKGSAPQENADESIRPFTISVPDELLEDLRQRLQRTRLEEPLEGVNFQYGFNTVFLRSVLDHWLNKYDWRAQEKELNKYQHFKTNIEGIDVHFLHAKPSIPEGKQVKVLPLLITHGWPGSFYEFYKIIPLLINPNPSRDFVFEVICPSIPGYGFSESPHQIGFDTKAAARVFVTLMSRLGFEKFYVQGGDWGAIISVLIGKYHSSRVIGVHVNMNPYFPKGLESLKAMIIAYFPSLVPPNEFKMFFPFKQKVLFLLKEMGYLHLQATKPDTLGCSVADSPAGMAAYIMEKFCTWTNVEYLDLPDGGLTKKFTLDELLTNVMIYWVNNNFTSSVRFYKESFKDRTHENVPLVVPSAIAMFPHELIMAPRCLTKGQFKKLLSFQVMPRGGHFAAFEEPTLLADDIWRFVDIVQREHLE